MVERFRLFGEFSKTERLDDGTLKVSGVVSSEIPDSDGDVVTAKAMRDALPDYMRFGAVREMHGAIAAGTALYAEVDDDGRTRFEALIVDAGTIKKLSTDPPVLKGFSIGGKVPKGGRNATDKRRIEKLSLTEVSLVDRPANPEAVIELCKLEKEETMEEKPVAETVAKAIDETKPPADPLAGIDFEKLAKAIFPHLIPLIPAPAEPIAKAEEITKLQEVNETLAKAYKALHEEHQTLRTQLDEAISRGRSKGFLRAVPVEKAADTGGGTVTPEVDPKDTHEAIRKVHRGGARPFISLDRA
jgi:hypothetical protein